MSERGDLAKQLFKSGYNCAQAVLCAFTDLTELDEDTSKKISVGFGGGIGRMREVCGTFTGAVMALGAILASKEIDKGTGYAYIQELADTFKRDNGSIVCRELLNLRLNENADPKPTPRTEEY